MDSMWSKIRGFNNYSVSKNGDIRNDITGELKNPVKNTDGYYRTDLYADGKRTTKRIHRIVGEAFISNPSNKSQINHKDGNKLNNRIDNLEWVTPSENMIHAFNTGLAKPSKSMLGKANPNAGRKGKSIRIVETGEVFNSITECEKAINGSNKHICDCLSGRQQTHRGYHYEYL